MRTTKTTEVIEEFDEQGRVVRRTTTTTEETENGASPVTYPWTYNPLDSGNWSATTTTANITPADIADKLTATATGSFDGEVTLRG